MITVDLSQWAAVATIIGVGIGLAGLLLHKSGETQTQIDGVRAELKGDIAEVRYELRAGGGRIEGRLTTIEQRTYDLSVRLPPAPAGQTG